MMNEPANTVSFADRRTRFGFFPTVGAAILGQLRRHLGIEIWSFQTRPLHADYQLPTDHEQRFNFKALTLEEALVETSNPEAHMTADFVRQAFERDDLCMAAYEGERLVASVWRSLNLAPAEGGLWLRILDSRCRYGYKSLVIPEYRGMRLNTSVGRFYDHHFVSRGIVYDLGYVSLYNLPSLKSTFRDPERRRIGYALIVNWWGRFWTFRSKRIRSYVAFEVHE